MTLPATIGLKHTNFHKSKIRYIKFGHPRLLAHIIVHLTKVGSLWFGSATMLFTSSIISTLALAAAPVLAIPPPIFGFPDSDNHTELGVAYTLNGNKTVVQEAMLFGYNSEFGLQRRGLGSL